MDIIYLQTGGLKYPKPRIKNYYVLDEMVQEKEQVRGNELALLGKAPLNKGVKVGSCLIRSALYSVLCATTTRDVLFIALLASVLLVHGRSRDHAI